MYDCSDYPEEQAPFDYYDRDGKPHVMCACGHWVTGPAIGTKIAMCPNCNFRARFGESIEVKYLNRLPSDLTSVPAVRRSSPRRRLD